MPKSIKESLFKLGEKLVDCPYNCDGISHDKQKGILPRCMVFDEAVKDPSAKGAVIVGINPGKSKDNEKIFYLKNGINYGSVEAYWKENISDLKYYNQLRKLVEQLGITGPILWSELVKCENSGDKLPEIQTFRHCTGKFLKEELNIIQIVEWPIFAVGKVTFNALAYLCPERIVIGVPHPTGSHGHFSYLFDKGNDEKLKLDITIEKLWNGKSGLAIWLNADKDS